MTQIRQIQECEDSSEVGACIMDTSRQESVGAGSGAVPPAGAAGASGPRPAERFAGRWRVALLGTVLQVCLGTVYAWSYFQKPVAQVFGCSQSAAAWAFSLAIGCLGLAAAWGGLRLDRYGATRLAMAGGVLYATGYLIAALAVAWRWLGLFHVGFGVVGGIGLGLGYVTPVATVARWFPDKKGLATGLVVMGFGLGALVMSKLVAPLLSGLFHGELSGVLAVTGLWLLAVTLPVGWGLRNPPPEAAIQSDTAAAVPHASTVSAEGSVREERLITGRFLGIWLMFFCNIAAGIMFIGFQSPMLQELLQARRPELTGEQLAAAGATLIAISSLGNGLGRLGWGGLSDRWGRVRTFGCLLGTQCLVMVGLRWVRDPWLFSGLVCYVLLCYGGGFGTMPSLVLDSFGARRLPRVYGAMLTAWSAAGLAGPQVAALIRDRYPDQASAYTFTAAALLLGWGCLLAVGLRTDRPPPIAPEAAPTA